MTTAVATKANTDVSTEVLDDIFETAGDGAHYDSSEMQIPFIRVLQALSPQLNKNKPEFIKGASNGDIYNTVTGEFWSGEEGITVIPVYQETKYLEFVPRSQPLRQTRLVLIADSLSLITLSVIALHWGLFLFNPNLSVNS